MHSGLFRAIGVLAADIPAAELCADKLFGGAPKPPSPPPPTPMPDPLDPVALAAQKKRLIEASSRSGLASTLLSGEDYSGQKLGTL